MLELEDGRKYGACFKRVTALNAGKHATYTVRDCRKHCRELGADLATLAAPRVQEYVLDKIVPWKELRFPFFWIGATYNQLSRNWTWVTTGARLNYSRFRTGRQAGSLDLYAECGEPCAVLRTYGRDFEDVGCGNLGMVRCLCQVPNATRDDGAVVDEKQQQPPPFWHTTPALALVLLCIALVGVAYAVAAYTGAARARVAVAAEAGQEEVVNASDEIAATIETEAEAERKKFESRLDATVRFLCFNDKKEETLFLKTVRDAGMEDVCNALTRTVPSMCLGIVFAELLMIEGLNSIPGVGERLNEKHLGGRPLIMATMLATLLIFSVGFFTPRKSITVAIFPHFAVGCTFLTLATLLLAISVMVRYGTLSEVAPWDGQARMINAMLLIYFPRTMHLSLASAIAVDLISVVSLEISLTVMYSIYGYSCGCYHLASNSLANGS